MQVDRRDTTALLPQMSLNEVREEARLKAWDMKLKGVDEASIATRLNTEYGFTDPRRCFTGKSVSRLLDRTLRSRRVLHQQDAGERLLLAEGRMEMVLEETWSEIEYERRLRERWLSGEFDPKVDLAQVLGGGDGKQSSNYAKARMVANFTSAQGKDPRFNIPKLLDTAANVTKEIAKMHGVSSPDAVQHITVNNNHMSVMAQELLDDPRTALIGQTILDQLAIAERSENDDDGDASADNLGDGPEAGYIDAEYISSGSVEDPLGE